MLRANNCFIVLLDFDNIINSLFCNYFNYFDLVMRASSLLAFRCYFELPSINKDFTSLHFTSPRVLPWQQYSRCHFVSFVMYKYITGAKFEDHCSNISGDILNSVFYRFSGTIYDVITSLICIIQKPEYL